MLRFLFASLLLTGTAAPALAQQAPRPDGGATADAVSGDDTGAADADATVVVTANRSPQPIDRVAASVTVLDKAAIDRNQDLGVTELLARTPGVSVTRNGGYGTATAVRIRGAETDQTVLVIDGVKLNDPAVTGGGYNFGNLLVGDASRIEVLRGPQSILWGSQAIGGVVSITTPLPERPLEASFDVEAGSRNTVSGRAGLGGETGPLQWRVAAQTFTTDGISALDRRFGGSEADGYTNQSVQGRAVLTLAPGLSADVRGYYSHGVTDYDGFGVDDLEYGPTDDFVGYAGLNLDLLDGRFRNRVAFTHTSTDRDTYNPDNPAADQRELNFDSNGRNERVEYQGSLAIAKGWDAVFGVEHEHQQFRTVSIYGAASDPIPPATRGAANLLGEYAELNAEVIHGLTLTGGIRHDDHSRFGDKTLFSAGGVWVLPTGTVLRASYGEGFKAPSLYQLYSDYGNTSLAPEQAHGWEAGAEQRFLGGRAALGGTYFERRSTDLIGFVSCFTVDDDPRCASPATGEFRYGYYFNTARALARGIEAVGQLKLNDRLVLDGNYTWNVSEDRSPGSATYGFQLARRPRHEANGSISYSFGAALPTLGAAVRWSGASFDDAANTTRLAPYTLVDLRAELPLSATVKLVARAENVLDEQYETAYGYGTLGRSVYVGFRGRF